MQIEEAKKILGYQLNMKDTDVYTPINYEAIETVLNELEKKDKVIDEMAKCLSNADDYFGDMSVKETKEYFYKKVE
jgi:hypothetical protein